MGRILQSYTRRFENRLRELNARRHENGLRILLHRALSARSRQQGSLFPAIHLADLRLQRAVLRLRQIRTVARPPVVADSARHPKPPEFLCDSGLGGLARCIRAAGYRAVWKPDFDDAEAVQQALATHAVLLTTDGPLFERRILRDGQVTAFWIAPALSVREQLRLVRSEFALVLQPPRCMQCGGNLVDVEPQTVWDRIPPRTRLWLNQFFVCQQCQRLFWHGTHWQHIRHQLEPLPDGDPSPTPPAAA